MRVGGAAPNALAELVLGTEAGNLGCGPCTLAPIPVELLIVPTDADGEAELAFAIPPSVNVPGFEVLAQWLVAAPSGCSSGLSMSNALSITFE